MSDMTMLWRCKCGAASYNHYDHCPMCGFARPPPPPPKPPSDLKREDKAG